MSRKPPKKRHPPNDHIIKKEYLPKWFKDLFRRNKKPKFDEVDPSTHYHINLIYGSVSYVNDIDFCMWLKEVLRIKRWREKAEIGYGLNFDFSEDLE